MSTNVLPHANFPQRASMPQAHMNGGPVFICYAHEDAERAEEIRRRLEGNTKYFVASTSIPVGECFSDKIKEAITMSREMWLLVSKHSVNKKWVLVECGAAWVLGKPIVPILLEDLSLQDLPECIRLLQARSFGDLDQIIAECQSRARSIVDVSGVYDYMIVSPLDSDPQAAPMYEGVCTIFQTGTSAVGFDGVRFDGRRTKKRGVPLQTHECWHSVWAARCPDGRIRVEYVFKGPNFANSPSFASLEFPTLWGPILKVGSNPELGTVHFTRRQPNS